MKNKKIAVVAQIPPPHLGQSIMHKYLVDDKWDEINKQHIKIVLTKDSNQFGKFSLFKFIGILKVIFNLWIERCKGVIDILYYPPSGPVSRKTFYKDFSILFFTRFLARKTVFHFHADKFNNLLNILNKVELFFARKIYGSPDLCIVILEIQKNDVEWLKPKKIAVIPNGIEDVFDKDKVKLKDDVFTLLYIGLLVDYKGIEDAILACSILKKKGLLFKWVFVGGWSSEAFKSKIEEMIINLQVQDYILFVGEKKGKEKWSYFEEANVLCLPTRNDLMPLCVIEGMMMSLPIISTTIRTIPCIVDHGLNGLLSNVSDPNLLADSILTLALDPGKCDSFGRNGREKFEDYYQISKHLEFIKSEIYKLKE